MSGEHAPQLAVLMTCHNRREKTLAALESLERQRELPPGTRIRVHLVDAGSTDGTGEAVRERFPEVDLFRTGTDVFWGTGTLIASRRSRIAGGPAWSHQLWLNDDVRLAGDAVAILLAAARQVGDDAIVVGAVTSGDGSRTTYSGRRLRGPSRWHPRGHHLRLVEPTGEPEPCDTYNGNVVLVSRAASDRAGDVDRGFRHGMGDYDHGFRAARAGVRAYVAGRHVGVCEANPPLSGSREPGIGVAEALRRRMSQRELPCGQWARYCGRHLWPWAPLLMFSPYVTTTLRGLRSGRGVRR